MDLRDRQEALDGLRFHGQRRSELKCGYCFRIRLPYFFTSFTPASFQPGVL